MRGIRSPAFRERTSFDSGQVSFTKENDRMIHPVATPEQHSLERFALEIFAHPTVREAFEHVRLHWLEKAKPSADMRSCFDASFEEVMFAAVIWSVNQDPLRPKVVTITRLAHSLGDLCVPGTRWGIDNPDSVYRVIPISGARRYEIRGRVAELRLPENYFTLWDQEFNTVDVLNGSELTLDEDRRFVISVDSEPAGDRANHVRSTDAAHEFYIRDVLQDWGRDTPNELEVVLLGDPPEEPARTVDEQAALTAGFMLRYADSTVRWNRQAYDKPANELEFKIDRETDGALRNQIYILGHFLLEDDQALVIDVNLGGANYFVAPITNCWGTTNEIETRTSSLNREQSTPNHDGTYTYVLSKRDPGVANWLDPCDMAEGILTLRWAEFDSGRPNADAGAKSRVVAFSDLASTLPAETRWVAPTERRAICDARKEQYRRRLPEGEVSK